MSNKNNPQNSKYIYIPKEKAVLGAVTIQNALSALKQHPITPPSPLPKPKQEVVKSTNKISQDSKNKSKN